MLKEFEGIAMRGNVMGFALAAIIDHWRRVLKDHRSTGQGCPETVDRHGSGGDFSELTFTVGDPVVKRGAFVESVIDLLISTSRPSRPSRFSCLYVS